jgi:hypothetical protein
VAAGASLSNNVLAAGFTYRLPAGNYTLNNTLALSLTDRLCILGAGSGSDAATGTVIRFTTAVSGRASALISGSSAFLGLFNLSITLDTASTAKDAGTILVISGATLRAEGVAFRGIGSTGAAGAVDAFNVAAVNLTDALFEDCFAKGSGTGGAMRISGASVNLYGATAFVRTYASTGGAVRVVNGNLRFHGPVTATNVTVSDAYGWVGAREGE